MHRRTFLAAASATLFADVKKPPKRKIYIFSKHLQFLKGDDLAAATASIGFDGIDLTVRDKGHVQPERVAQDLPPLVSIIRKHGLEVPMVTAGIVDANSLNAEDICKVLADLKITKYRWGGFKYDLKKPMQPQFDDMKRRIAGLSALNGKYGLTAMYHTHSGVAQVGASIWDIYMLLKEFDPKTVAINYDIGHATIEGGLGGWIHSLRATAPYIAGIAVKDFLWEKDSKGAWKAEWCPIGDGMVRFAEFFRNVGDLRLNGPMQMHVEYDLGGADQGKTAITIPKEQVFAAMKKDLGIIRTAMA